MVGKNSFIINFKKLPGAFFCAMGLLYLTNASINILINHKILQVSHLAAQYRNAPKYISEHSNARMAIIGNSVVSSFDCNYLSKFLYSNTPDLIYSVSLGGSTPRTYEFLLDTKQFRSVNIKRPEVVVICMSPEEVNRFNRSFEWTIFSLFTWKEFFTDLVLNGRTDNVEYYLKNCSFYLMNHRFAVRKLLHRIFLSGKGLSAFKPILIDEMPYLGKELPDETATKNQIEGMRIFFYSRYAIDQYQVNSLQRIIAFLKKSGRKVIFVLLPLSVRLRSVIGDENITLYVATMRSIAELSSVDFLDYETGYTGNEYLYYDGSHFTQPMGGMFCHQLAIDLMHILQRIK